jgi:Protein of unknown function (DUF642)
MKFTRNVLSQVSFAALATCALIGGQVGAASAADNLIINGSFESGTTLKDGGWGTYDSILGWKATKGGKIEVQRGAAGKAYDGKNLVELDSHNYTKGIETLGIFQDVATTIGKTYSFSFAYSARPNVQAADNILEVLAGNVFKQKIEAGKGGKQTDWKIFSSQFVANSTTTRLQFNDKGIRNTTLGAYIDDVKMQAVPEPTAMLGLSIAGMSLLARKKKRQSA